MVHLPEDVQPEWLRCFGAALASGKPNNDDFDDLVTGINGAA